MEGEGKECTENEQVMEANEPDVVPELVSEVRGTSEHTKIASKYLLHQAAQLGQMESFRDILNSTTDLDEKTSDGLYTPLHAACMEGHYKCVEKLMYRRANAESLNANGMTPMHVAAACGHVLPICVLLTERRVRVDAKTVFNSPNFGTDLTPLHFAACGGHFLLMLDYFGNDAYVNMSHGEQSTVPVPDHGIRKKLQKVLREGSECVNRGKLLDYRVWLRPAQKYVECVRALVQSGADVNAKTSKGYTPVHLAAISNRPEILRLFLYTRVDFEVKSYFDFTPLHLAAQTNAFKTLQFLLLLGVDSDAATSDGKTLLHLTCERGNSKMLKALLLQRECNMDLRCNNGQTALHLCAMKGHLKCIRVLLDNWADSNCEDDNGYTPIMSAALKGQVEAVKLLLRKGGGMAAMMNKYVDTLREAYERELAAALPRVGVKSE